MRPSHHRNYEYTSKLLIGTEIPEELERSRVEIREYFHWTRFILLVCRVVSCFPFRSSGVSWLCLSRCGLRSAAGRGLRRQGNNIWINLIGCYVPCVGFIGWDGWSCVFPVTLIDFGWLDFMLSCTYWW